ncbi:MAG: response regulator transcription factor [Myxococcales bacterium]|nr:response regulator transcription factor [Myxococcales bacterium]
MSRVLLVEDERLVADMVRLNLEHAGCMVVHTDSGEVGLARAVGGGFDVLVLDVMLPGIDGMEVARRYRALGGAAAILMLTARGEVPARVAGLDAGADDYLTKPFAMAELVARVRALARRAPAPAASSPAASVRELRVGPWVVSVVTREATRPGAPKVALTETEISLLALLVAHPGEVLARADILESAWGMDRSPTERTVDNYVMRLRRLFEEDVNEPRHFLTLRGVGYRFEP